jgi:hypothetical protein
VGIAIKFRLDVDVTLWFSLRKMAPSGAIK